MLNIYIYICTFNKSFADVTLVREGKVFYVDPGGCDVNTRICDGKVIHGYAESTATLCGVNYQLLVVVLLK